MSKKHTNSDVVGFIKFNNYPDDLATTGFYLRNIDSFTKNGTQFIQDPSEGKINFKDGSYINYKDLIKLFQQKDIYCQSYVSCFTTLKTNDFNSDYYLKKCTMSRLLKYAEGRDCVLFGSDLNKVFSTIYFFTVEFHNKYLKNPSYNNTDQLQTFNTVNAFRMKEFFSPYAWSCIYDNKKNIIINDSANSTLISELKANKMLESVNNVYISMYADFVDYSDETASTFDSFDALKKYVVNNMDNKGKLEKLLEICLCNKNKEYSFENEYRVLITEFSDTAIKFPNAIKLLYPEETNNTDHTKISQLNFPKKGYASLKDIKLTDFKDVNLQITSHY